MTVTHKMELDFINQNTMLKMNAVQGDTNTRVLQLSLYSNGTAWMVPEGVCISMRYSKPDGTKGIYDTLPDGNIAWKKEENVITMILAPQMLTAAGPVSAQLEIVQGNTVLATFTFYINVAENPAAGVLSSEDYINWLQWMEDELRVRVDAALENGDFAGPPGEPGGPAEITGQEVVYQTGESAENVPSGEWSTAIPPVPQGRYLWTRITVTFNYVNSVTWYSVTRFGTDKYDSVPTVCGVPPDSNGNIVLDASSVGALPIEGGTMNGPLNIPEPTENTHAANKAYVDGMKLLFAAVSVPEGNFIEDNTYADFGYCAAVPLSGVTETMIPDVAFALQDAISGNFAPVAETYDGGVYIYAAEIPESAVTIPTIICWRGA